MSVLLIVLLIVLAFSYIFQLCYSYKIYKNNILRHELFVIISFIPILWYIWLYLYLNDI